MLDSKTFKCIVANTPLVSIDFLVQRNDKYLLGKRTNPPAKGYYFTIGGRIFKDETIQEAIKRILKNELNLSFEKSIELEFIGIFEHFYNDSVFGEDVSTHYINLAYLLELPFEIKELPKEQHSEYKWFSKEEILDSDEVHKYIKDYFKGSKYV